MTEVNIDYDAIANAAAESEDQTKMKEGGGGFDRPVPRLAVAQSDFSSTSSSASSRPITRSTSQQSR